MMRATHTNYKHPRHLRVEDDGGAVLCMSPSASSYARLNRPGLPDWNEAQRKARLEAQAEAIYNSWSGVAGWVPWVPGGNSFNQDKARGLARQATNHQKEPTP